MKKVKNRINNDDIWRKKVKAKYFKFVHSLVKDSLKINVNPLPQKVITEVNIRENKKLLSTKIFDLYSNFSHIFDEKDLDSYWKENVAQEKKNEFKHYLFTSFEVSFTEFLNSIYYESLKSNLESDKGRYYLDEFHSKAEWLIHYYKTEQPNKTKFN